MGSVAPIPSPDNKTSSKYREFHPMKKISLFLVCLILIPVHSAFAEIVWGPNEVTVGDSDMDYLKYLRYMTVPFNKQKENGPIWQAGSDAVLGLKTPAEIPQIVQSTKEMATDPVQREIVEKMKSSRDRFIMRDEAHAAGRVLQRLKALEMMHNFNEDARYTYYDSDSPVGTTATRWTSIPRQADSRGMFFFQKSGTAYDAIMELCSPQTKSYGECKGAIAACIWWGTASAMETTQSGLGFTGTGAPKGKNAFNAKYPGGSPQMRLDMHPFSKSLNRCLVFGSKEPIESLQDFSKLVPGDSGGWVTANYGAIVGHNMTENGQELNPFWKDKDKLLDPAGRYLGQGENVFYTGRNNAGEGCFG